MQSERNWILKKELSNEERQDLLPYGELLSHLLFHRGIKTIDEAEKFLNPSYERDLHDPFLILNMGMVVDRILRAISEGEKVVIYGDYDCDGIPGSVILHDFFKKIGYINFYVYIPHRHLEGYGLNIKAIEKFAVDGVRLIITVDNGITDVAPVDRANELGIDVIITDHHLPQAKMPSAYAILNSKQHDDKYPFDMLCGAGVAFKLVQALLIKLRSNLDTSVGVTPPHEGWSKWLLDMAGLSTIADMVPLRGENRVLAYFGLKVLQKSSRPGLMKLLYKARVPQSSLCEEDVGFTIAPRINAASRMGEPIYGFNLLAETDDTKAGVFAEYLESKNNERKRAVDKMMREVLKMMETDDGLSVIVLGHKDWAPGVVGLAAGRIVDKYKRPAFVWGCLGSDEIKGSCRSDGRVNIVELMISCGEGIFTGMGGHALAGGFSVSEKNLEGLNQKLSDAYLKLNSANLETKFSSVSGHVEVDRKISLDEVTLENYYLISKMAPFGVGNKKPVFLLENLEVFSVNFFGASRRDSSPQGSRLSRAGQASGDHLRLDFKNSFGEIISAVLFKYKDSLPCRRLSFVVGDRVDLLAYIEKDNFGYTPKARLRIIDLG